MRRQCLILCVVALGFVLAGCRPAEQPVSTVVSGSMKGYEIYSRQEGGQWYFSLLVGTNREKTPEEISATDTALSGVEGLRPALEALPSGQFVTWLSKDGAVFPPEDVIDQVRQICTERGLELAIAR
jgi:hypothetical protein